jgi:hypothetical protein
VSDTENQEKKSSRVQSKTEACKTVFGIRYEKGVRVAMACANNIIQYISYEKLLEMVHNEGQTRVIENFIVLEKNNTGARGQLLGIYDKNKAKFVFVRGVAGKVIRQHDDVLHRWEYPFEKKDLDIFIAMAEYEEENKKILSDLISNYDSLREYDINLDCE